MPETGEALRSAHAERNARQVILPAVMPIFLDEALERASPLPDKPSEQIHFREMLSDLEDLNFCPALTSMVGIYGEARKALSNVSLGDILTPEQIKILTETIEWSAVSPDGNFKENFMTSYPAFALGYIHEMLYAGDEPKPTTAGEVIELLKDPELDELLLMGMHATSGVSWGQSAPTPPDKIFRNLRDLYDYGSESPFVRKPDGSKSLKPEIIQRFHDQMRERNQEGERAAVGCPVAVTTIHNLSQDPESSRHLSQEQLDRLLETKEGSKPIARQDSRGTIRIEMDILARLREFFTEFAESYIEKYGVPVLVAARSWEHKNTVRHVDPEEEIPPATMPEPREDCKSITDTRSSFGMPDRDLCDCAAEIA